MQNFNSIQFNSVNPAKSKYMIFALKNQQYIDHLPPLQLNNSSIDRVFTFGIWVFCPLVMFWASHVSSISQKVSGLIYWKFYKNIHKHPNLPFPYHSAPCLEYGSPIWDPPSSHSPLLPWRWQLASLSDLLASR